MRVAFAGTPEVAVPALDALVEGPHQVVAAITRPDAPQGRSRRFVPPPVAVRATELELPVWQPASLRDPQFAEQLQSSGIDAVAVVAYGKLIPDTLLDQMPWINLHFSLLPRWRGAAPVQHAIWAGDTQTGVTTFDIVEALDAGPIYRQVTTEIEPGETAGELLTRLAHLGAPVLNATLDDVADRHPPVVQLDSGVSTAAKITVADARIDWHHPVEQVWRQVRATTPNPGAWTHWHGERFKVLACEPDPGADPLAPGELRATKRDLWVGCADHPLRLVQVQAFGKKAMAGPDWARGVDSADTAGRLGAFQ